jgi:hypothetical protein
MKFLRGRKRRAKCQQEAITTLLESWKSKKEKREVYPHS